MSFISQDDDAGGQPGIQAGATNERQSAAQAEPASADPATDPAEGGAEPGSPENPLEISDPRALRALAHPGRLAILQHLVLDGPATATECAEVAGLSPSACSYHLRALARYGFVDEDPSGGQDRRHRPWRARVVAITVGSDPNRPAPVKSASRLLADSLRVRFDEVRAEYESRESQYSAGWQRAAGTGQDVLHVTPGELEAVIEKVHQVLSEYRRLRREDRPSGARRVHVMLDFTPWFAPENPPNRPLGQLPEESPHESPNDRKT
ncbi:MAG: helix-turn-helix domain-containing protein, partial [Nocardiopsaceae bacterium]|nr:helix-turn-helix domain-containing protein [Nocardiopsaceae bacterium]